MASAIASPIERVRQAVPIGEIAAERVALVKAGRALKGLCPFHAEQTPSFYVYPESGRFHCFGCLPSGHLVKTADGVRPIEDVRVGDLVVAGDGRLRPVVRTYHYPYAGDLVRIRCNPFKAPLLLTPDHKVPVVRPRSGRIEEVPAGDLRPDNHLQYVPPRRDLEEPPRDALPTWERTYGPRPKALPAELPAELLSEWLGWYLAEGSVSNDRTVRFSLSAAEGDVAARLRDLTRQLFDCELRSKVTRTRSKRGSATHSSPAGSSTTAGQVRSRSVSRPSSGGGRPRTSADCSTRCWREMGRCDDCR